MLADKSLLKKYYEANDYRVVSGKSLRYGKLCAGACFNIKKLCWVPAPKKKPE